MKEQILATLSILFGLGIITVLTIFIMGGFK